ncbi:MAG TPA: UDP-N-acetylglucosamine--N-acetylmuramyl-(pentapeptide) pyrophosphoryl-undecaprenol N-acetylglucosamine transferase [Gemmatimonadaceae bacterium]|nr:UDP-N-acetylglucosamine--N-acetylmuramyl-(pentapeptide) pyrophosphoryl-undecaprenol N-acetylglucosamine transferase [Gemmatimonadaceae bacterium]
MKSFFAGGGTGGHLYPGLAIARALVKLEPEARPFFIGAQRGIEREVLPKTEFPFLLLDLHPLYRSQIWKSWRTVVGGIKAWRGIARLSGEERPRVVVGTGGYASAIALAYGAARGIPLVLQEQNSYPGIATRVFSRFARQIHLGFPEARKFLKPRADAVVYDSGNPIQPPPATRPSRGAARGEWGFSADARVLLVFGGSQGALAINEVVAEWVRRGIPDGVHVIWATGKGSFAKYAALESDRVRVRDYIAPMESAYAASDIALARAGAMSTAELAAWGVPMILVPLPTAAADHQTTNARALEGAGAARVILQRDLTPERLDADVRAIFGAPGEIDRMSASVLQRARPRAADEIAGHILELMERG